MRTEIHVSISGGKVESIEVIEKKPEKKKISCGGTKGNA